MTAEDDLKKIKHLLQGTETKEKPVNDIQDAILQGESNKPTDNEKKEYNEMRKEIGRMKTAIMYCLHEDQNNSKGLRDLGKKIIEKIEKELKEEIKSPKPVIVQDGKTTKSIFRDGSEATPENYNRVEDLVSRVQLINKTNRFEDIKSEALGFVAIYNSTLWKKKNSFKLDIPFIKEITIEGTKYDTR